MKQPFTMSAASSTVTITMLITILLHCSPLQAQITPADSYPLVAVASQVKGTLFLISPALLRVVGKIPFLTEPRAIAASPDGRWLLAASASQDLIQVVDLTTHQIVYPLRTLYTKDPVDLAFSGDGTKVWILSAGLKALVEIKVPTWELLRLLPLEGPNPVMLKAAPELNTLFVVQAHGVLTEIDLNGWRISRTTSIGNEIGGVCYSQPEDRILLTLPSENSVSIRKLSNWEEVRSVPTGEQPGCIKISPDGQTTVVVNQKSHDLTVFKTNDGSNRYRTATGTSPREFVFSLDGKLALVSDYDSGDLAVVDVINARLIGKLPLQFGVNSVIWVGKPTSKAQRSLGIHSKIKSTITAHNLALFPPLSEISLGMITLYPVVSSALVTPLQPVWPSLLPVNTGD